MNDLKQQIQTLLSQDIMLEQDFKKEVLSKLDRLNKVQMEAIIGALLRLVNQEESILAKATQQEPYFFLKIQHQVLEIMHQSFLKQEAQTQAQAEQELAQNIARL